MKKHMYYGIVLNIILFAIGCGQMSTAEHKKLHDEKIESQIHKIPMDKLEVIEIDGCEYIFLKDKGSANQGFGYMAHKGNCKNPIHSHNKKTNLSKIED